MIKHLDSHIAIKHLNDQIREYQYQIEASYSYYVTQWYQDAIASLEKRIDLYK